MLQLLLWPFLMCLVLAGIHGYLGIHVLSRKVIFVDLALAQIAALGTTFAFVLGYDAAHHPADASKVYWFSLTFTLIGAAVFAITRMRKERVPHEAFIGIVYASASALAILVLSKGPGEGEHIKSMLVGNILLVVPGTVLKTACIYAAIGLFHWFLRRRFFQISLDPEAAEREGVRVRFWDFLFYASFGVVITSSVAIAGVLLVFSYLVVPAVCAVMLVEGLRARILAAWAIGFTASLVGIFLSYVYDLPTGPAVVATFAGLLVALGAGIYLFRSASPLRAAVQLAAGAACIAAAGTGLYFLRNVGPEEHEHHGDFDRFMGYLEGSDENLRIEAIHHLEETKDPHALARFIDLVPRTPSESPVLDHLVDALGKFPDDPRALDALQGILGRPDLEDLQKVHAAEAVLILRDARGLGVLVGVLSSPDSAPFARKKAADLLREETGKDFSAAGGAAAGREAISRLQAWWAGEKDRIKWRENLKKFE